MHFGLILRSLMIRMISMIKTYTELIRHSDFYSRFLYAKLNGRVGEETFGWHRYLNQELYTSKKWKHVRDEVIIRDEGCDLAHPDFEIRDKIIIHHLNPIALADIENESEFVLDPEFLICVSSQTHRAIHYGDSNLLPRLPVIRRPGDTCPWR